MKKLIFIGSGLSFITPLFALAADDNGIIGLITIFSKILGVVIPVLVSLAVVYFIWGVIQYLLMGNEEKKKKAKEAIISGLIGLFVIVSFWGIVKVITNTTNVGPERLNERAIPCVPNTAAGITCN